MHTYQVLAVIYTALLAIQPCIAQEEKEKSKEEKYLNFDTPNGLLISLAEDDSKATFGVNIKRPDELYGLSLSGKLTDKKADFVGIGGLNPDVTLKGSYTRFFADLPPFSTEGYFVYEEETRRKARDLKRQCNNLRNLVNKIRVDKEPAVECHSEAELVIMLTQTLRYHTDDVDNLLDHIFSMIDKCKEYKLREWAEAGNVEKMCKKIDELHSALNKHPDQFGQPIDEFSVFNISLSYLQTKFEWLDIENIAASDREQKSTKEGIDITVSYANVNWPKNFKWEVGAKYQKGYAFAKANTERELCFVYESESEITECVKGRLLPPLESESIVPFVSLTKRFFDGPIDSIGLNIGYTFEDKTDQAGEDTSLDRWGVEVPMHVITFLDKKISAGLKMSWVSETRDKEDPLKFSIFISAPIVF